MPSSAHCPERRRSAFTLVELLVVIGIIGVVAALSFPAVQAARESTRRATCQNNLRQQLVAVHTFHSTFDHLPPGKQETAPEVDVGWGYHILPYIEQQELFEMYDPKQPIDEEGNDEISQTPLPVFWCPAAPPGDLGKSDYGGVSGSALTSTESYHAFNNGALIPWRLSGPRKITLSHFPDGTAFTIMIGESADREPPRGLWVSGGNIFGHHAGQVNQVKGHLYSLHPNGCNVGFADGAVRFLSRQVKPHILGALCTRGHGERLSSEDY